MKKLFLFICLSIVVSTFAKKQPATIKVMSYNIRHGYVEKSDTGLKHWDNRNFASINMIHAERPDIIGMQEVKQAQQEYLEQQLPEYQSVFESRSNTKFIMYRKDRFTQLDWGNFWLSETPNVSSYGWGSVSIRATTWVKLKDKLTGKVVYFFDTHLDVKSYEARVKGAALCTEYMKKICGKKAIQFVVGDMNTWVDDDLKSFASWMQSARIAAPDTDERPTFNGFGKSKDPHRLDHIFYRNVTPVKYQVLDGKNYGVEYISDHYPVMFTAQY